MAWNSPATATVGQILTDAFLNAQLRDNMLAIDGIFDIATAPSTGRVAVGDDTDFKTHAHLFISAASLLLRQELGGLETDISGIAAGGLFHGDGAGSIAILTKGTALQLLQMNSGATDVEWASPATDVSKSAISFANIRLFGH